MEDRKEKKSMKTYDSSKDYKSGKDDKSSHDKKGGFDDYNKYSFQFFVHKEWCEFLQQNNGKVLDELKSNYKLSEIYLDNRLGITGLKGEVMKIIDKNMEKKISCVQELLQKLQFIDVAELDIKSEDKKKRTLLTIVLLIPEKFVSQIIGIKGKQISQIIKESRAEVVVNQPIYKMYDRTVILSGKIDYVLRAFEIIYQLIEDKAPLLKDDDDSGPVQVLPLHKTKITAKFIFYESMVGFIIGTNGCHTKHLLDKYDVTMKVKSTDSRFRDLKRDETVCYLIGKLPKVQRAIEYVFKIADEYYYRFKSSHEHIVKILIPTIYVPKLIGASGCMIKELANKSGGASIKIISDKNYEKFSSECCIKVAGELESKIVATNLIVEQVEMFRSGGPVLMTGKTIFQNLAEQVNDSYQAKESFLQDYADQSDQYKKKQKKSKSRSRSKSKSKSKGKYKSKSRSRSISNSDSSPKSGSRSPSIDMRYKRGQDANLHRRKKSSSRHDKSEENYHQRRSHSRSLKKNKDDQKKHMSSNERDSRSVSSEEEKYHKQQQMQRKQIKKSSSKSSMSPNYNYDDNSKIIQKNLEEIYKGSIVPASTGENNLNHHYVNKKGEKIVEIKVEINNNIKQYLTYTKIETIQSKSNCQISIDNSNAKEFFVLLIGKISENARAFQMIQEIIVESEQLINQKKESQIQDEEIKSQ